MDFDWIDVPFDLRALPPKEIEETFEDPFSIRMMLENADETREPRYYNLGKSISGRGVFTVFWTDGKRYRAIFARDMVPEENTFYERKNSELGH